MIALITILDDITETSMPFNEFVVFRANHYHDEKQFLIVCNKKKPLPQIAIPNNLTIIYTGKNIIKIRKVIINVIKECKKNNWKYAFHLHQVQSALLSESAMIGTGFRKKTLFTVHNTFPGYSFHNKALSLANALFAREISCVSNTAYDNYPNIIKLIKGKRIRAIQNGVDIERIDTLLNGNEKSSKDCNTVSFIYVARMVPVKNHKFLLNIISKTNENAKFIFVGKEEQSILNIAEEKKVKDRIVFTGLIPRNEVFNLLSNSNVYVSPSLLEGLPVSVLEGMYCGLPCLLSNIPQHLEVVKENDTSIQVLPLNEKIWIDAINHYTNLSKNELEVLGKQAKATVLKYFSLNRMHNDYNSIYKNLYN